MTSRFELNLKGHFKTLYASLWRRRHGLLRLTPKIVQWFCIADLFFTQVGAPRHLSGSSMVPTLNTVDLLIQDNWTYKFRPPARGELIIACAPYKPGRFICKRVIGIEGDIICVDPTGERAPSDEHVVVPKGHVWVMGDNASWSYDSRDYGPLSISLIQGRAVAKLLPPLTIFRDPYKYMSVEDGTPL